MPDEIVMDENGFPVLLAEVPNAGIVRVDPDTPSGNPRHDIRSGKFGRGSKPNKPAPPANADPIEYRRYLDAVRDAAREFDTPDVGDIRDFLSGRAKNPAQVNVEGFMAAVKEQIRADLVDALDDQIRRTGVLPRSRRRVRVQMPRGYTQRTLRGLTEDEIAEVMHRLEAKGHDRDEIDKFFERRVKEGMIDSARQKRDTFQASNYWISPVLEPEDDYEADEIITPQLSDEQRAAMGLPPADAYEDDEANVQPATDAEK